MTIIQNQDIPRLVEAYVQIQGGAASPDLFFIPAQNYHHWAYPSIRYKPRIKGRRRNRRCK